jgi:hypothetical protein
MNNDGKIDLADANAAPGEKYDVTEMDAINYEGFSLPAANKKPYTDQWGTFVTGYANVSDQTDALLAVDIYADKINELTNYTFPPSRIFFALILFLTVSITALQIFFSDRN